MKILIISMGGTPTTFGNCEGSNYKYGNPSVEYLTSYLRSKNNFPINTIFLNKPNIDGDFLNEIDPTYDIYGIFVDIAHFAEALRVFEHIKKNNINTVTFAFGRVASYCTEILLASCKAIDYVIIGDPEEPAQKIIDSVTLGNVKVDETIAVINDSRNKKYALFDQDVNRWPCFDYYENDSAERNKQKIHCLTTKSDTCSGKCNFCWSVKKKLFFKDEERIFDEIEYVSRVYGIRHFYFIDNNLFDFKMYGNKERLLSLFNRIKALNRNLLFTALANTKSIVAADRDLYILMKEIGFYSLFLGVDSGNSQDLELYNKKTTLIENHNALKILKEIGIWARYGFIYFNPFSTLKTIRENFEFLCFEKSANVYHYGSLRMIIFENTKFKEMVQAQELLGKGYCGIDIYNYHFMSDICEQYYDFISKTLVPLLEKSIQTPYLKLKKNYEMAKVINPEIIRYQKTMEQIEEQEYNLIRDYFYQLYVNNDIDWCINKLERFVSDMKNNAKGNDELLKIFEKSWMNAPLEKEC